MPTRPPTRPPLRPLPELPPPFTRLQIVPESPSTNTELLARPERGLVLVAEHQSAGLGRLGRVWTSPPRSGLTVSVALEPGSDGIDPGQWSWLPLLAGVALVEAVSEPGVGLKWPNDLLWAASGEKLAGILVQSDGRTAVIGVGLNVTVSADELPIPNSTSLQRVGAGELDRTVLLQRLLRHLGRRYLQLAAGDLDQLRDSYSAHCLTLGQPVRVSALAGEDVIGSAVGIDVSGRLLIRTPDGAQQAVSAGDVLHLRGLTPPGADGPDAPQR